MEVRRAELPLRQPREARDGQRDVVDDDRDAGEAQPIADPVHGVAGGEVEKLRGGAVGLGLANERNRTSGYALGPAFGTTWKK